MTKGLGNLKIFKDLTGNEIRDIASCGQVPQSTPQNSSFIIKCFPMKTVTVAITRISS